MSDDRESQPAPILASDAEREHSITQLRDAVGEGRLTLEEFSDRVGLAQSARTNQDLARLTRDLPAVPTAASPFPAASEQHRAFCSHLTRSGPWSLPSHSSWRSIFGTIDLDVRQARLAGPEIELPERPPVAGAPRLTIDIRGPGGTLRVRSRPNPTLMRSITDTLGQRKMPAPGHRPRAGDGGR